MSAQATFFITASRSSTPTATRSARTEGAHSREPGISREVLFLARGHGFQSVAHPLWHHRRRDLLGPVVPGVGTRDGDAGRGDSFLSDRDRLEPQDLSIDSRDHWQRAMQGHAASNIMPLVASNRVGTEQGERWKVTYYGSSFIADHTGAIVKQAPREGEAVLTATFDLDAIRTYRTSWGVFRDRRPELYGPIMTLDGKQCAPKIVRGGVVCSSLFPVLPASPISLPRSCAIAARRICASSSSACSSRDRWRSPIAPVCGRARPAACLLPLGTFPAATHEQLYEGVSAIDWAQHIKPKGTLAIDFGGASSGITHTHFGALKTKDAIVDQFRARTGERPSVQLDQPDVRSMCVSIATARRSVSISRATVCIGAPIARAASLRR